MLICIYFYNLQIVSTLKVIFVPINRCCFFHLNRSNLICCNLFICCLWHFFFPLRTDFSLRSNVHRTELKTFRGLRRSKNLVSASLFYWKINFFFRFLSQLKNKVDIFIFLENVPELF